MLNSSKGSLTHRTDLHLARMYRTGCRCPADAMCEKLSHVRREGHAVIDVRFIQFGIEFGGAAWTVLHARERGASDILAVLQGPTMRQMQVDA